MAVTRKKNDSVYISIGPAPLILALMREHYRLQTVYNTLGKFSNCWVFSKLDVRNVYWHTHMYIYITRWWNPTHHNDHPFWLLPLVSHPIRTVCIWWNFSVTSDQSFNCSWGCGLRRQRYCYTEKRWYNSCLLTDVGTLSKQGPVLRESGVLQEACTERGNSVRAIIPPLQDLLHTYTQSVLLSCSLAPRRSYYDFKNAILNLVLLIGIFKSSYDNVFIWMPHDLTDD